MKYKNTTFVNILLIYSHYKLGKPFLKGAPFFLATPCTCTCIYIIYNIELFLDAALVSEFCVFHSILLYMTGIPFMDIKIMYMLLQCH